MPFTQAAAALSIAALLIALGLVPGPLVQFEAALLNFHAILFQTQPVSRISRGERFPGQGWVAVIGFAGVAIILIASAR